MKVSTSILFSKYNINQLETQVEAGLDFILQHVSKPDWPRRISTKATDNRQFMAHSRLEALSYFKQANYLDCRISAYAPDSTKISIALIDIDRENFKSKYQFNKACRQTLLRIKSTSRQNASKNLCSVLSTGHGNHCVISLVPVKHSGTKGKEFL